MEKIETIMARAKESMACDKEFPIPEKSVTADTKVSDGYLELAKARLEKKDYLNIAGILDNPGLLDALLGLSGMIRAACDGLGQAQTVLIDKTEAFADYIIFGDESEYFDSKPFKKYLDDNALELLALYMLKTVHRHWCINHAWDFLGHEYEFMPMILVGVDKLADYFDIVSLCLDSLGFEFNAGAVADLYLGMQKNYLRSKKVTSKRALAKLIKSFAVDQGQNLSDGGVENIVALTIFRSPTLAKEIVEQLLTANPQMLQK